MDLTERARPARQRVPTDMMATNRRQQGLGGGKRQVWNCSNRHVSLAPVA
ncbi:hypothetical protein [Nocardia cyriacigeorgica]|nr:hypothetical protein [Nocardia cyriacigeorgica]MBF6439640.1 hypothetical protein [Nocardia cyriacigeorgica]